MNRTARTLHSTVARRACVGAIGLLTAASLAACSGGESEQTAASSPATAATPSEAAAPASSTPSTSTATADAAPSGTSTPPASASTPTTQSPGTPTPSTVPADSPDSGPPQEQEQVNCPDIGFAEQTDAVASGITIWGSDCGTAHTLVRDVEATHDWYSGPSDLWVGDVYCSAAVDESALPTATYDCAGPRYTVTWTQT